MTAPERINIDALRQKYPAPKPHHHSRREVLEVVYADPGNNGFYYREEMPDSVAAYARVDLLPATPDADVLGRVMEAMRRGLNYIQNTECELGITLDSGDALRAALRELEGGE